MVVVRFNQFEREETMFAHILSICIGVISIVLMLVVMVLRYRDDDDNAVLLLFFAGFTLFSFGVIVLKSSALIYMFASLILVFILLAFRNNLVFYGGTVIYMVICGIGIYVSIPVEGF